MERSFAVVAGFEHEAELLVGLDDLRDITDHEVPKTPEAVYTETVLKLDGGTYDIVDGQEGFLDNIKRGATKVYEWIKSIIKAIKEWLFGKPRREVAEVEKSVIKISKELDEQLKVVDKATSEDILRTVADLHVPEAQKQKIKQAIQRIPADDRAIINQTTVPTADTPSTDKSEKIISEMSNRLISRVKSVKTNLDEIKRVDPEGIVSKELGIDDFLKNIADDSLTSSRLGLGLASSRIITDVAEVIVKAAQGYDIALADATKHLEKMNNEGPFAVEDERSRQVSRAAKVVLELGNAANKMRDLVVSLDSQLMKTAAQMETIALSARVIEAMKHTREPSNQYLQMVLDELKM